MSGKVLARSGAKPSVSIVQRRDVSTSDQIGLVIHANTCRSRRGGRLNPISRSTGGSRREGCPWTMAMSRARHANGRA